MTTPNTNFIVTCPHCSVPVIIEQINCAIFRHGSLIRTGEQIPPHLDKANCDNLLNTNQINGCGKPFRVIIQRGQYVAVECEYI